MSRLKIIKKLPHNHPKTKMSTNNANNNMIKNKMKNKKLKRDLIPFRIKISKRNGFLKTLSL